MSLINKMIRATKLDVQLYEEVEKDREATKEAFLVVLIGGICNGIGIISIIGIITGVNGIGTVSIIGVKGIIIGLISGIIGWLLWSAIILLISVKVFKHASDMGELLRTLGFAYSPSVLSVLGIIPKIGHIIRLIASIWVLVASVIAVRQALDCETGRAILISVLGFIAYLIVFALFFSIIAGP